MKKNLVLRNTIFARGYNQYEVAKAVGINKSRLTWAIWGRVMLKPEEYQKIAEFLKVDQEKIFPVETLIEKNADKIDFDIAC